MQDKNKVQLITESEALRQRVAQLEAAEAGRARPISERRLAEQERESTERYRAIFAHSPIAIELYDAAGVLVDFNPACLEIFGVVDARELEDFDLFADPNLGDDYKQSLRKGETVRYQAAFDFEKVKQLKLYRTSRSGSIWLDVLITPLGESPSGYLVQIQDITERVRTEAIRQQAEAQREAAIEALQNERWRLQSIIEGTHVGTWEWNIQTGETIFNEVWAQIIGYTLAELAPISIKTWEALAHPDDLKESNRLLEEHFAGALPYYDYECRMKHKDGHWIWVHDRGRVITRSADGQPLMMFGTHTDITAKKQAEEQLKELATQREWLVRDTYHRVKNNLMIVEILLKMQAREIEDPHVRALFQESQTRVRSMLLIHEKLHQSQDLVRVDFGAYLQKLGHALFGAYKTTTAPIALVVDAQDVFLSADVATSCGMIINELISNTLKHAFKGREGGTLRIALKQAGGQYVLTVSDDGVGFPKGKELGHTKTLGMKIVTAKVDDLEGKLELDCTDGTTWRITFAEKDAA
jgi:PAS domain S-box-containing protein